MSQICVNDNGWSQFPRVAAHIYDHGFKEMILQKKFFLILSHFSRSVREIGLSEDPPTSTDSPAWQQTGDPEVDDVFSFNTTSERLDLTTVTGLPKRVLIFTSMTLLGRDGQDVSIKELKY